MSVSSRVTQTSAALLALVLSASAHANLITNGSFELGTFSPVSVNNSWVTVANGQSNITGWSVGAVAVDWHNTTEFQPMADGFKAVDLNLTGQAGQTGTLSQTFATDAGSWYDLSFWLAGPGLGLVNPRQVLVDVAGLDDVVFQQTASLETSLVWGLQSLTFQALSSSTTLSFASANSNGYWGALIDNVSVTAASTVPEPGSMALLGLGLAALGVSRKRKPRV